MKTYFRLNGLHRVTIILDWTLWAIGFDVADNGVDIFFGPIIIAIDINIYPRNQ